MELPEEDAGKASSLCGADGTQALPEITVACPMDEFKEKGDYHCLNTCDVCEGEGDVLFPVTLCEESNCRFL